MENSTCVNTCVSKPCWRNLHREGYDWPRTSGIWDLCHPFGAIVITKFTHIFYAEESDNSDDESDTGNSVCSSSADGVGETIEDAVATISTEIVELDKIGFEQIIDVHAPPDM